ncbi:DUF2127 domain-containing protein [Frigidibacter sp. RF13]|uniref:DUF2127 domain-containing protein n=1 Tax=Frigidibacter sp. RF13 TaxID=2997340 RepID=UPI00227067FB|nr:DUF2127 domain-containing protein [Frigidibacter sp. RF13]MCY1125235.1 DUF2127 domain-containing protein [Frigidibacter sp. RF13]
MVRQTAAWAQGLLHRLFTATLAVKGSLASLEAAVGGWLWMRAQFPSAPSLPVEGSIAWLTQHELTQDADDPVVRTLAEQAQHLPLMPVDNFYYFYLVMHGFLKLVMVALLARKVRWAYPAAMALLAAFVAYQGIEFTRTHSIYLLMLCGFDMFMIWLVGREYGLMKRAV